MIISREHRFIFLKSRKTASTSTEIHLIKNTPLGRDVYHTSSDALKHGLKIEQNNLLIPARLLPFRDEPIFLDRNGAVIPKLRSLGIDRRYARTIRQRMKAKPLRSALGQKLWDSSIKVCCVRNPWDNMVSIWKWVMESKGLKTPFKEFLRASLNDDPQIRRQTPGAVSARFTMIDFLFIEREFVVDQMIRFESINESLADLAVEVGVPIPPLAIHEKGSARTSYREYYTGELRDRLRDYFSPYLERTGYEF